MGAFSDLDKYRRGLRPGAFWMTGDLLMRLVDAIIRIHAVVFPAESVETNGGTYYDISATAGSGGVIGAGTYALQVYPSIFAGTGDAPADQAQRVRVRRGSIAQVMPGNIDNEFVLPDNQETIVYYIASHDDAGQTSAVTLDTGTSMPSDPIGAGGHAPPLSYGAIARVTVAGGQITQIVPDGFGSRSIAVIVSDRDCDSVTLSYFTTPVVEDFTSAKFQEVLARLDAAGI